MDIKTKINEQLNIINEQLEGKYIKYSNKYNKPVLLHIKRIIECKTCFYDKKFYFNIECNKIEYKCFSKLSKHTLTFKELSQSCEVTKEEFIKYLKECDNGIKIK